jgi:hypothetical protein
VSHPICRVRGRRSGKAAPRAIWLGTIVLLSAMQTACGSAPPTVFTLTGSIPVSAPPAIEAGQPLRIDVGPVDAPNGAALSVVVIGSYGPRLVNAVFHGGRARVLAPDTQSQQSGTVTIVARSGQAEGTARTTIVPGPAVEPVTALVGARAVVADRAHWSIAVVVPFDRFANPLPSGTMVHIGVLHADGSLQQMQAPIAHLLAWTKIYSHVKAGSDTVVARVGNAHGPTSALLEVAGLPAPFTVSASPTNLPADGQSVVTLRTSTLVDRFGNILPDGMLTMFHARLPDGTLESIPAQTVDGVATATLQAPREQGVSIVWASVFTVTSGSLKVPFAPGPAVGTFSLTADLNAAQARMTVMTGALLGELGAFVPDGTPVSFSLANPSGAILQSAGETSTAGHATWTFTVADLAPGAYQVRAGSGSAAGRLTIHIAALASRLPQAGGNGKRPPGNTQ